MTYLILRFQSLGNVAMTVPVLESVCRHHPHDTFIVVAKKRLNALFFGIPNLIFHEADFNSGNWKGLTTLYHELCSYPIDAVIDLQDNLRTHLLRLFFRMKHISIYTIDYGRTEKRKMTLLGANAKVALPTEFERYARTLRQANLITDDRFKALSVNEQAQQAVVQQYGAKEGTWIGIAPFAKYKSNTLPYRVTKEMIIRLSQQPHTRIYLFGAGQVESEWLRQWASIIPNVVSVAGVLPLEQELELMRLLDTMVCMDSANQHLAALVDTRVISIWMGTHPAVGFGAWKQHESDRLQLALYCRPCTVHGTNRCRFNNFLCQQIDISTLINKLYE